MPVIANGEVWTVADPFLARRIRAANGAGASERSAEWAELQPLLAEFWRQVQGRVVAGHAPGRLKLWLNSLRLLRDAQIRLARHYLLYPNPWPKIGHLARRWHGHPVFPDLPELGGRLECRSNWRIYVEEFCFALNRLTQCHAACEPYAPDVALTPFERKYMASGHPLYRVCVAL